VFGREFGVTGHVEFARQHLRFLPGESRHDRILLSDVIKG
jgi:hypothetical protein